MGLFDKIAGVAGGLLGLGGSVKQSQAASLSAQEQSKLLEQLRIELESTGFQGPGGFSAGVNFGGGTQGQFAQRPSKFGGFKPVNSGFDPRGTQARNGNFFSPGFLASQGGQDQFAQAGGAGFRGLNPQFFGGGRGGGFGGFGQQPQQQQQQPQGGNSLGFQLGDLEPSRQGLVGVAQQGLGRTLLGSQQDTLGLLRAQARPFESFAFDDLQERLFGQGNRNSSAGGRQTEGFFNALFNADLGRQLASTGENRAQSGFDLQQALSALTGQGGLFNQGLSGLQASLNASQAQGTARTGGGANQAGIFNANQFGASTAARGGTLSGIGDLISGLPDIFKV